MMPILNWEDSYLPQTSGTSTDFLKPPSITEDIDLTLGPESLPSKQTTTITRSFKVRPRNAKNVRQETEEITLLEKWEGYVSEILPDGFRANLQRSASEFKELVAEFEFSELADDDREILAEGMPLVWSITRERRNGVVKRCSVLMLRRQPRQLATKDQDFTKQLNEWIHPNGSESTGC